MNDKTKDTQVPNTPEEQPQEVPLEDRVVQLEQQLEQLAQAVQMQNGGMRDFAIRISKLEQANVAYGPILNEAAKLVPIGSAQPQGRGCGGCKK